MPKSEKPKRARHGETITIWVPTPEANLIHAEAWRRNMSVSRLFRDTLAKAFDEWRAQWADKPLPPRRKSER